MPNWCGGKIKPRWKEKRGFVFSAYSLYWFLSFLSFFPFLCFFLSFFLCHCLRRVNYKKVFSIDCRPSNLAKILFF
ncbi:hypothetical protein COS59_01150 [Candidatus Wolfebacteria bacterium CG03_land_8_20_14_0_80_36_15]|uniref:Uncharacterized protein n=1 Tax=Candidatus Wolfebacteria bacterium CG03_land_8_20_14_0_80_36_15 TaxID=1975067 RepID=A0A2M7B7W0_9BACT|nr:MAG: hypothetical protein COS59_01150 [Candidatus Wolfebacteria bacterium CG03_land_8_20_14_0_80_36_15]